MAGLPHVVLIIMDTVSAKRCSVYGYGRDTTPGLSRIAREATLYRHCFAPAPWTIPSLASLFSGLYPSQHACDEKSLDLPETFYSLPEILQQAGYYTVAVTSNLLLSNRGFGDFYSMHTLVQSARFETARRDFEAFKQTSRSDFQRLLFLLKYSWQQGYFGFPVVNLLDGLYRKSFGQIGKKSCYATERTVRKVNKAVRTAPADQPLFVFVNFMETHWHYNPPPRYVGHRVGKANRKAFEKMGHFELYFQDVPEARREELCYLHEQALRYLDRKIFGIFEFFAQRGLLEKTLFIVTADHGESIGEHGLWGHNFGLYNELIHIPLIVKYPGRAKAGSDCQDLVQLQDLYATILEIAGLPLPVPPSSQSLLSGRRDFAVAELNSQMGLKPLMHIDPNFQPVDSMQPCRCIIDRDLNKLVEWADGRLELYDLKADYGEAINLADSPGGLDLAGRLRVKMREILG